MPSPPQPQTRPARDPALDGLRGVAILLVYIFHYGGGLRSGYLAVRAFGYLTQAGWVGVEIFFALSGFLITGLLRNNIRRPHGLLSFFARRGLRILPVYYGALGTAAVAALVLNAGGAELRPLLLYAGFLQNLPPLVAAALRYPPPLPLHHLWSLAVEEQFYLVWPLLLLATRTRRQAFQLCLSVFLLSCVFRLAIFSPYGFSPAVAARWSPFLLTRAGGLALGGALALCGQPQLTVVSSHLSRGWTSGVLTIAVVVFLAVGVHAHSLVLARPSQFILMLPAAEIAAVAMLALALAPGLWRSGLELGPLRALGRISYGFYVLHILLEPLFDAIGRWSMHTSTGSGYQLVRLIVAFPITTAAAALSYLYIERPFLRLKHLLPAEQRPPV